MPFDQPLSDDQIREQAPSVFATHAADGVSDRYAYLPSYTVLRQMRTMGLQPVAVAEGRKKAPEGRAYAMHQIRFRKVGDRDWANETKELGQLVPEVILRNSHDRTSPLDFSAGIRRLVCLNGMTVAQQEMTVKVRHVGRNTADQVYSGVAQIINRFGEVIDTAKYWRSIKLTPLQLDQFAQRALQIRGTSLSAETARVLRPTRWQDEGRDLWNVFNRAQENLTKGNVRGQNVHGQRRLISRITSLSADIDLNRKLWGAAAELAEEISPRRALVAA